MSLISHSIKIQSINWANRNFQGEVTYSFSNEAPQILKFSVPRHIRISGIFSAGERMQLAYDEASAEQLAARLGRPVAVDLRDAKQWTSQEAIAVEVLKNKRDLMSLLEGRRLARKFQGELMVALPKGGSPSSILIQFLSVEAPEFKSQGIFSALHKKPWFPQLIGRGFSAPLTVSVALGSVPKTHRILATGRIESSGVFQAASCPVDSVGLLVAPLHDAVEGGTILATAPEDAGHLSDFIGNFSRGLTEIIHVIGKELGQEIPHLSVAFLPENYFLANANFQVFGDLVVFPSSTMRRFCDPHSLAFEAFEPTALAIGEAAVAQLFPAFSDEWIRIGLVSVLAGRVVEAKLGINEFKRRFFERRFKWHEGVERGEDWLPLVGRPNAASTGSPTQGPTKSEIARYDSSEDLIRETAAVAPLFDLKAGLVMEALRSGVIGATEFKLAVQALVARGNRSTLTTDSFLNSLAEPTAATDKVAVFRSDFIEGVGCPRLSVGIFFGERKSLTVSVRQRPLQPHQAIPVAPGRGGGCFCGKDFVSKSDMAYEEKVEDSDAKRRCWEGSLDISVFRAPGCPVPATVDLRRCSPSDAASTTLSVTLISARKHEIVRPRQPRPDELVHGWVAVDDDQPFILSRIHVCQGTLMWTNQLQFSRDPIQELEACAALSHCRGSQWVLEVLADAARNNYYAFGTRIAAGKALIHLWRGGEREALKLLWGLYLGAELKDQSRGIVKPQDIEVFVSVIRELAGEAVSAGMGGVAVATTAGSTAGLIGSASAGSVVTIADLFLEMASRTKSGVAAKRIDEKVVFEAVAALYKVTSSLPPQSGLHKSGVLELETTIRADLYGPPLSSKGYQAAVKILCAFSESPVLDDIACKQVAGLAAHSPDSDLREIAEKAWVSAVCSAGLFRELCLWLSGVSERMQLPPNFPGTLATVSRTLLSPTINRCSPFLWKGLAVQVESNKNVRSALRDKIVCDALWKVLVPEMLNDSLFPILFEIYHRLFGTKVPKEVEAAPVDHGLEKAFRKFVVYGRTHWQPESVVLKQQDESKGSKIVIGKIVRDIAAEEGVVSGSTGGGIRIGGIVFKR